MTVRNLSPATQASCQRGLVDAIVDDGEGLACLDLLIIRNRNIHDVARNLRAHREKRASMKASSVNSWLTQQAQLLAPVTEQGLEPFTPRVARMPPILLTMERRSQIRSSHSRCATLCLRDLQSLRPMFRTLNRSGDMPNIMPSATIQDRSESLNDPWAWPLEIRAFAHKSHTGLAPLYCRDHVGL